jgi:cell division protein FtsN
MAKAGNTGSGGGSPKSKVMAGLVIGVVLGVTFAGFVAWYVVTKNPASFTNKELREPPKVAPQIVPVPASAPVAASGVGSTTKFEFYKELPDKPEGSATKQVVTKPQTPAPVVNPPAKATVDSTLYLVQAGSFQNASDAEKLKAKLALVGMEASVQKADIPGKGVFHRVRLGPYKGMVEANATIANLKQNGISNATALHAQ